MKENKGITLIALIITIIVMLILVGVTISAVVNSDIIGQGEEAAKAYENKQAEEQNLNFVTGEGKTIANYLNPSNEDEEVPDKLKRFILGSNLEGRSVTYIMNSIMEFNNLDNEPITDAKTSIIAKVYYCGVENTMIEIVEYDSNLYGIEIDVAMNMTQTTKAIYKIDKINENSRVGKLVSWDSDGKNGAETWIILYDDDEHGLQIISANAMEYKYTNESSQEVSTYLFLGLSDTYLKSKNLLSGSTDIEKAINSYNSVISTLNSACNSIITERTHVSSVRSVGSNPNNKENENSTYLTNTILQQNPSTSLQGVCNDKIKGGDNNLKSDVETLCMLEKLATTDARKYWLASRSNNSLSIEIDENQYMDMVSFSMSYIDGTGAYGGWRIN